MELDSSTTLTNSRSPNSFLNNPPVPVILQMDLEILQREARTRCIRLTGAVDAAQPRQPLRLMAGRQLAVVQQFLIELNGLVRLGADYGIPHRGLEQVVRVLFLELLASI
jgi:hypothetical protein